VFWLDVDHVVDPPEWEELRRLLEGLGRRDGGEAGRGGLHPHHAGVSSCSCDPGPDGDGGQTVETDSINRKRLALIARCHQRLGDTPAALAACTEGLSFFADDAELRFRQAVVHRSACQPSEAES
jgi:hypothetical protein